MATADFRHFAPSVRYVLFDLHGTLIDSQRLREAAPVIAGRLLAARYGGDAAMWASAHRAVAADWHSYYADLNLSGDDSRAHMLEGMVRTTRAYFRITGITEPALDELQSLASLLQTEIARSCNALYNDVADVITALHSRGYQLGIASSAVCDHARALLEGGQIHLYFDGPLIGFDTLGTLEKDVAFYHAAAAQAGASVEAFLIVDGNIQALKTARRAGMAAVYIDRTGRAAPDEVFYLKGGLFPLLDALPPLR